jgi:Tfp pilus assembly protein PilF
LFLIAFRSLHHPVCARSLDEDLGMYPQIDNPAGLDLSPDAIQVLQQIFARYKRVIIIKEFTVGLSGGRVLEVRPIKADGTPELPTVVKLATISMIQQEWRAYQKHIHNRLPHVASVTARPTILTTTGWGGLRYPMMGGGDQDIISLYDFCRQPDVGADHIQTVLERLLRIMDNVWGFNYAALNFSLLSSYELVLPPHLLIRTSSFPAGAAITLISPRSLPRSALQPGDAVSLTGFAVQKVDPARRTVTLRGPATRPGAPVFGIRLRISESDPMPDYRAQQIVDVPIAEVIETRESRLRAEVAELALGIDPAASHIPLAEHAWLPNPLEALPKLLKQTRSVNIATIHGDFNLENILLEPQLGDISLIDFAEARQDHVLHDLLHLETEIVTHILPNAIQRHQLDPVLVLVALGWRLHRAMTHPAHEHSLPQYPELRKPWVMLRAIRRAARRYLFDADDPSEYYQGLTLYLLGALRYKNLSQRAEHPLPKRIAFWAATLAYQWLLHPDARTPPPVLAALLDRSRSLWTAGTDHEAGAAPDSTSPTVARSLPHTEGIAADLLAALPIDRLPPVGRLPSGSRMLLERNPRFVGRQEELKLLAAGLKRGEIGDPDLANVAMAIVGMGGIGKTQLACEFAYRFGRFFAGGVFWLSCADPQAVPTEIAACGEREALNLRVNFGELPQAAQVQLVLAEWQKPIPRLLIFDNCEAPDLLTRWRPQHGACRILVTSRRADWETTLGIPTLAPDVLRRADSLALLREHQPDAEGALLDAIAGELGDLPLALHLAGSYLARYRHTTDASGYLAGLRRSSPLEHQSLRAGGLLPTEHVPHVARTFALSYDQLDGDEPAAKLARRLIYGAACLAPGEPIPESLVRLALDAQHEDAAEAARVGFELGSAINQLVELGLARVEANRALWLHRLVVAFTRERMSDLLERVQSAVERALHAEAERLNALRDPAELRGWQVHLRFVADAAQLRGDVEAADLCHTLAEHLYQTGDYHGARAYHKCALSIRQAALGADHPATARSLRGVGQVSLFFGDVAQARPYFEQALAIQTVTLGDHDDTATTLNNLGFLLQRQGQLAAARQCHEEALRMRRSVLGAEHPAVVESLCNLAYIEYAQGNLDAAHDLLQQALAVQRKATGDEHPETASVLTNLGDLLVAQGKLEEAEGVFSQALAIQERELGAEHPETARTLGGLGDVRHRFGDATGAKWYYERALNVFLACHGADHFRTRRMQAQLTAVWPNEQGS